MSKQSAQPRLDFNVLRLGTDSPEFTTIEQLNSLILWFRNGRELHAPRRGPWRSAASGFTAHEGKEVPDGNCADGFSGTNAQIDLSIAWVCDLVKYGVVR
jgi:hypothetical protein